MVALLLRLAARALPVDRHRMWESAGGRIPGVHWRVSPQIAPAAAARASGSLSCNFTSDIPFCGSRVRGRIH
eukprot:6584978-Pyramimonas_sp.AAC.1